MLIAKGKVLTESFGVKKIDTKLGIISLNTIYIAVKPLLNGHPWESTL
jgi:hypothetical protein